MKWFIFLFSFPAWLSAKFWPIRNIFFAEAIVARVDLLLGNHRHMLYRFWLGQRPQLLLLEQNSTSSVYLRLEVVAFFLDLFFIHEFQSFNIKMFLKTLILQIIFRPRIWISFLLFTWVCEDLWSERYPFHFFLLSLEVQLLFLLVFAFLQNLSILVHSFTQFVFSILAKLVFWIAEAFLPECWIFIFSSTLIYGYWLVFLYAILLVFLIESRGCSMVRLCHIFLGWRCLACKHVISILKYLFIFFVASEGHHFIHFVVILWSLITFGR